MNVQGYTSHEEETDVTKLVIIFPTGRVQSITDSHPHFETLRTRIQTQDLDAEEAEALINERVHALNAQVNRLNTRMAVENGNLMVDGAPAHSALANHILRKIENGDDDYMRVVMFYENALDMPDGERDNLFAWLSDNGGFSLTEDGHVVAGKVLRNREGMAVEFPANTSGINVNGVSYAGEYPCAEVGCVIATEDQEYALALVPLQAAYRHIDSPGVVEVSFNPADARAGSSLYVRRFRALGRLTEFSIGTGTSHATPISEETDKLPDDSDLW